MSQGSLFLLILLFAIPAVPTTMKAPSLVAPTSVGHKAQASRKVAMGIMALTMTLCVVVLSSQSDNSRRSPMHFVLVSRVPFSLAVDLAYETNSHYCTVFFLVKFDSRTFPA